MRFSYIDSQGKEIEVDSVESLALRIELGAIKPDTRMYDAVADRWAPAEEHPVFRSLSRGEQIEEEEIVAIGEEEADLPGSAAIEAEETEVGEESEEPEAEPTEAEEESGDEALAGVDAADEDPLDLGFEVSVADEGVEEVSDADIDDTVEDSVPEEMADEPEVEAAPEAEAHGETGETEEIVEAVDDTPVSEDEGEEAPEAEGDPDGFGTLELEEPDEGAPSQVVDEPTLEATWLDEGEALWEADESEGEERLRPEDGGARSSDHREALEEDLADPRRKMPEWAAGPAEATEPAEGRAEARRARDVDSRRAGTEERPFPPRPAHWDRRRQAKARRSRLARIGQVAAVLLLAAGASYVLFGSPGGPEAEGAAEGVAEPLLPLGQWTAMATAADRAWTDVLNEFRSALPGYGLPYRPPVAWLEGIYLSNASDYPGVVSYWEDVEETVGALQALESQLYFQHLNRHLERMAAASGGAGGVNAAVSAGSVPRILEVARMEFQRTASARDSAYQDLFDVVTASLDLHVFLVDREEDILYEPFTDPSVSRDPVLEAVPVDSILRVEMNANLDRVIEAIAGNGIPRPITTPALFNHLMTELGRIETASDTPPPPDTLES